MPSCLYNEHLSFLLCLGEEGAMNLTGSPQQNLNAFVDSDWGNCPDDFILSFTEANLLLFLLMIYFNSFVTCKFFQL